MALIKLAVALASFKDELAAITICPGLKDPRNRIPSVTKSDEGRWRHSQEESAISALVRTSRSDLILQVWPKGDCELCQIESFESVMNGAHTANTSRSSYVAAITLVVSIIAEVHAVTVSPLQVGVFIASDDLEVAGDFGRAHGGGGNSLWIRWSTFRVLIRSSNSKSEASAGNKNAGDLHCG